MKLWGAANQDFRSFDDSGGHVRSFESVPRQNDKRTLDKPSEFCRGKFSARQLEGNFI